MTGLFSGPCPVCGGRDFTYQSVLWAELISEWQLSDAEVAYINRQQGFFCSNCHNNLRALALATAILRAYGQKGTLHEFCASSPELDILEINSAANLTTCLSQIATHRLVEYPAYDMMSLDFQANSFDMVIHSDSLEHVQYPERGLSECKRILREGGLCIFTVPIVVGRMTRYRAGLQNSFHGSPRTNAPDQLVHTEFGADAWTFVLKAGFPIVEIVCLEYPAGLALVARA